MTRAEAIKILINYGENNIIARTRVGMAFDMAIKSLETDEAYQLEYEKSTTKNDLGVDCISRDSAIKALGYDIKHFEFKSGVSKNMDDIAKLLNTIYETQVNNIKALPSVTPQEPKTGHCKDCKYFELDSWANYGGIPIIVAHEICKAWGEGCKTKSDGYCFRYEPQESEAEDG